MTLIPIKSIATFVKNASLGITIIVVDDAIHQNGLIVKNVIDAISKENFPRIFSIATNVSVQRRSKSIIESVIQNIVSRIK